MVDAAASLRAMPHSGSERVESGAARIQVTVGGEADLARYAEFAARGIWAPAQSPIWISQWIANTRPEVIVATATRGGEPQLSVALEVVHKGPLRIARFMSGRHANGNLPPVSQAFAKTATAEDIRSLVAGIRKARPDIDIIAFERLATEIAGVPNPLLLLPHQQSANLSLAVSLAGGFDALLGRASGKRKRKKHRSQTRKFETAGGFKRVVAKSEAEVDRLLDAFFAMKEIRFRKAGLPNVFAEPEVRAFFRAIFKEGITEPKPNFVVHGLEVGGKIRAVTGSSSCADRLICEFGAIADDDMAFASPGEFLFFDNIEEACREGYSIYDFSVGDEPYKRLWCDLEIAQFDVVEPLSAKGHAFAGVMRASTRLKAFVKNNRFVWDLIKKLRKKAAAAADEPSDD